MSELYIPTRLAEEMEAERQDSPQTPGFPVWFRTDHQGLSALGPSPNAQELLQHQQGWAQIALRALMDRVKSLQWFVGETRFDEDANKFVIDSLPKHRANQLLNRPNPIYSGQLMKMLIAGLVAHTGACYLQKLYDPFGVPVELWPIPTQVIRPVAAEGKVIGGYEVTAHDGQRIILPEEDVIRIWRPDLNSIYGELGMLGPQATVFSAQQSMSEQKRAFFDRDATPRTALIAEADQQAPTDKAKKRFNAAWRNSYDRRVGVDNGLPAYVPPGFEIHEFKMANAAQDVELDKQWARQVMAGYGVPAFAVGIDTNVNRSTGETTMWAWDQNSVEPMTDLIADAYTHQMMEIDFGEGFVVAFEDFVQPDKEHDLEQERSDLIQGTISINEVRRKRGTPNVSWGDLPRGTIGDAPYTGDERDQSEEEEDIFDLRSIDAPMRSDHDRADVWDPETAWLRNERIENSNTGLWTRLQMEVWRVQYLDILQQLAKVSGVSVAEVKNRQSPSQMRRRAIRALGEAHHSRAIKAEEIFQPLVEKWKALFTRVFGPRRSTLYNEAAKFAHDNVPAVSEYFLTPRMKVELELLTANHFKNVNLTTQRKIAEQLAAGQRNGESLAQLARRIEGILGEKRAKTVARTEVGAANQSGVNAGLLASGAVDNKVWNTQRDGKVRDSHRIDGQTVPVSEPFILLDGDMGMHPLDMSLQVENVANCRCFMTPDIPAPGAPGAQTNEG